MNTLSRNSKQKLSTCSQPIHEAINYALRFIDFGVACGHRGKYAQNTLFTKKLSKLRWPKSRHNTVPSNAIDLVVYVPEIGYIDENTAPRSYRQYYGYLAGVLRVYCHENNLKLVWGGDWDSDSDFDDQSFNDLMHFEITPIGKAV